MMSMIYGKHRQIGFATMLMGVAVLPGCNTDKTAIATPSASGVAAETVEHFSLDTPVEKIAANPGGNAILQRDIPGLLGNPSYIFFSDMSLTQIASLSGGRLTKTKLNEVQADLAQLPVQAKLSQ